VIYVQVVDYHTSWKAAFYQLEVHSDFVHYVELFGLGKAERLFKQHMARLRDEFISRRQNAHLHRLDAVLHKLLPDLAAVADRFVMRCHHHQALTAVYFNLEAYFQYRLHSHKMPEYQQFVDEFISRQQNAHLHRLDAVLHKHLVTHLSI